MNYLRRKWIIHGRMLSWCIAVFIVVLIGVTSFFMGSFERGQISVASGEVTCARAGGEWICEDNIKWHK